MTTETEAVWAAKLHVKTTTEDAPGTLMGTETILAICKALVDLEARSDVWLKQGQADHAALHDALGWAREFKRDLPPPWRAVTEIIKERDMWKERAQANPPLMAPAGIVLERPITAGKISVFVDSMRVPFHSSPLQVIRPEVVCKYCGDTHRMFLNDREVSCTHCPVPCNSPSCRSDATAAYCDKTPCPCKCHERKSS